MVERRLQRALVLALAIVVVVSPLTVATHVKVDTCNTERCLFKVVRFVPSGNYWTQNIEVDVGTGPDPNGNNDADVLSGSTVNVTMTYPGGTNESAFYFAIEERGSPSDLLTQHPDDDLAVGFIAWRTDYGAHVYALQGGHPPDVNLEVIQDGQETTFLWSFRLVGASVSSSGSVQTLTGWAMDGAKDYRIIAMTPESASIAVALNLKTDVGLAAPSPPESGQTVGTSGRLVSFWDWKGEVSNPNGDPAAKAPGIQVLQDAEVSFPVPTSTTLYGAFVPATAGATVVPVCNPTSLCNSIAAGAGGTTWGKSIFHVHTPSGPQVKRDITYPLCLDLTGFGGPNTCPDPWRPIIFNHEEPGTWTLHVDEHVAAGATPDMIAILGALETEP